MEENEETNHDLPVQSAVTTMDPIDENETIDVHPLEMDQIW